MTMVIKVPTHLMTMRELEQRWRCEEFLCRRGVFEPISIPRIPPQQSPDGNDTFLEDLIEHISRPLPSSCSATTDVMEDGGGASRTTEPAAGTSSATDVSLREFLMTQINATEKRAEMRFEHMKEQIDAAFKASQLAIDKADTATEKRFEGVNEFRAALSDQASRFVTAETLQALSGKLQTSIDRNREDLVALSRRIDLREGETEGSKLTKGNLYAGLAALATVVGLLVVLANYLTTH